MGSQVQLVNGRITEDEFKAKFSKYRSPDLCAADVSDAIHAFPTLKPYARECIIDGSLSHMLNLEGVIPIRYKAERYHIPIRIILQRSHPTVELIVYVVPTETMIIRKSRRVNDEGKVVLDQITSWHLQNTDLTALLHVLCVKFGECSPLWTRRNQTGAALNQGLPPLPTDQQENTDSPLARMDQLRESLPVTPTPWRPPQQIPESDRLSWLSGTGSPANPHPGAPRQPATPPGEIPPIAFQSQRPQFNTNATLPSGLRQQPSHPPPSSFYEPLYHPNSTYLTYRPPDNSSLSGIGSPQPSTSPLRRGGRLPDRTGAPNRFHPDSSGYFSPIEGDGGRFLPSPDMIFSQNLEEDQKNQSSSSSSSGTSFQQDVPSALSLQGSSPRGTPGNAQHPNTSSLERIPPPSKPAGHVSPRFLLPKSPDNAEPSSMALPNTSSPDLPPQMTQSSSHERIPPPSNPAGNVSPGSLFPNTPANAQQSSMELPNTSSHGLPSDTFSAVAARGQPLGTSRPAVYPQGMMALPPSVDNSISRPSLPAPPAPHELFASALAASDTVGQDIDDYKIVKLLGRGGFAEVYLLKHKTTAEEVAAKVVNLGGNSPDVQEKVKALKKDIMILKDLKSPFIIGYRKTVECETPTRKLLAMVMDFMPGGSIYQRVCEGTPINEGDCRVFTWQILRGLEYLHKKGVIHRDIKGRNILIDEHDTIKITDFGISKKMEELATTVTSSSSSNFSSVYWTSPELAANDHPDEKTDIWSAGCTVVEMLFCKPPLQLENLNVVQALARIITQNKPIQPPAGCSQVTRAFLELCFRKKQERPTATDLMARSDFPSYRVL